ncbi:MAG: hypothetical protein AAGF31_01385 [Planctomycetota bacterium]
MLDYDDSLIEATSFTLFLSSNYSGGGFAVQLLWTSQTATTGDVRWEAAIERQPTGFDLDSSNFGDDVTAISAAPSTAGEIVATELSISAAISGLPLAGERLRLRIRRNAADAGDTMVGDAELLAVEVREA